jgi:hypothetical protein
LSVEEQLERFGEHFSAVSQEFPPLKLEQLSDFTRKKLSEIQICQIPYVEEFEIHHIIQRSLEKRNPLFPVTCRLDYFTRQVLASPCPLLGL